MTKIPDYTLEYVFHRIDIDFVNANPNVVVTEKISADYDNITMCPINLRALSMYTNTNKLLMKYLPKY
jgi:hypothetical protein